MDFERAHRWFTGVKFLAFRNLSAARFDDYARRGFEPLGQLTTYSKEKWLTASDVPND